MHYEPPGAKERVLRVKTIVLIALLSLVVHTSPEHVNCVLLKDNSPPPPQVCVGVGGCYVLYLFTMTFERRYIIL